MGVELIGCIAFTCDMIKKHSNLVAIGNRIRELRSERGYSQEAIADKAGLGRTYFGRVERGEQNISIQNLIQIAFALKVEIGELVPDLSKLKNPIIKKTSFR